jgi:hypothetical protein
MATTTYRTTGWIAFAGFMMIFTSFWNLMYGLSLIFKDNWIAFSPEGTVLFDTSAWGWILLLTGVLKFATGYGLLTGAGWARYVGIVIVSLNMIEHMALIGAFPFWSLIVIAVSVFVLYALVVPVEEQLEELS